MNCERVNRQLAAFIEETLPAQKRAAVKRHAAQCVACGATLRDLTEVWNRFGAWPQQEPSPALREGFYQMLEAFGQHGESAAPSPRARRHRWLDRVWPKQPVWLLAGALAMLLLGLWVGIRIQGDPNDLQREMATLNRQVSLALLQHQAPSERLRGIQWSARLAHPGQEVFEALLDTLNHDANVNVRLAAVETLYEYLNEPKVREGLIRALPLQSSPLVQAALVDCLVAMGEQRAAAGLENLLTHQGLHDLVKQRAEKGLRVLR